MVRIQNKYLGDTRMKKHSGLLSAVSILLVIALVAGISVSLLSSGRARPDNPISGQPEQLQAESLQGSGSTGGQNSGKEDTQPTAPSEDMKNTDPTQDPSEQPTAPDKPDQTAPPTEPTQGEDKQDPTGPTDQPVEDPGNNQGGSGSDDNKGGSEDSGDHGGGTGGDDGDHGGSGGDHGGGDRYPDEPVGTPPRRAVDIAAGGSGLGRLAVAQAAHFAAHFPGALVLGKHAGSQRDGHGIGETIRNNGAVHIFQLAHINPPRR